MAKNPSASVPNGALDFIKMHKKWFITAAALVFAAILLLIIINPANSPTAVFNRYLDCMHAENDDAFAAISYDANFSSGQTKDDVIASYQMRFSSADNSYTSGGRVDLLKDASVSITKCESLKKSELSSRRSSLAENYRNTGRVTDICDITFAVKRGESTSTGTATAFCVTGKWYIGEVSGI